MVLFAALAVCFAAINAEESVDGTVNDDLATAETAWFGGRRGYGGGYGGYGGGYGGYGGGYGGYGGGYVCFLCLVLLIVMSIL